MCKGIISFLLTALAKSETLELGGHLLGLAPLSVRGAMQEASSSLVIARSEIPRLHLGTGSAIADRMVLVSRQYYVYIMTNKRNAVLYVGVTNDLIRRVYEHKEKLADGFTKKYNIVKLVYYEVCEDVRSAILREKQIKAGSRQKKIELVNSMNSAWRDLYEEL
jgi:putative endonuclease